MIFITKIGTIKIIITKIKDFGKALNYDDFVVKRKEIFIKIVKYGKQILENETKNSKLKVGVNVAMVD